VLAKPLPSQSSFVAAELDPASLGTGVWYTLRAEVTPAASTGNPEIKVYVDGIQVVLMLASSAPNGWEVDSAGTVTDGSTNQITSGPDEGFVLSATDPTGGDILVDEFNPAGPGSGGPGTGGTLEQDMLSVAVSAQSDGATGTLSVPADWPVTEEVEWGQIEHRFETDRSYKAVLGGEARYTWEIVARAQDVAEMATLRAFFNSHRGTEIPFTWTPPGKSAITVHFAEPSLFSGLAGPGVATYKFVLEKVI